jgi:hypothetical protein
MEFVVLLQSCAVCRLSCGDVAVPADLCECAEQKQSKALHPCPRVRQSQSLCLAEKRFQCKLHVRLEVLTAVNIEIAVARVMPPCSVVSFGGVQFLHVLSAAEILLPRSACVQV